MVEDKDKVLCEPVKYAYNPKQSVMKFVKGFVFTVGGIAIVATIGAISSFVPPDGGVLENLGWKVATGITVGLLSAAQNWLAHRQDGKEEEQKPV